MLEGERIYVNGVKEGPSKEYYPNGTIRAIGTFSNDELDGASAEYHPDGKIAKQMNFSNGKATDTPTIRANLVKINQFITGVASYGADHGAYNNISNEALKPKYIDDFCFKNMNCVDIKPVTTIKGRNVAIIMDKRDSFVGCVADVILDDGNPATGDIVVYGKNTPSNFPKYYTLETCFHRTPEVQYVILF